MTTDQWFTIIIVSILMVIVIVITVGVCAYQYYEVKRDIAKQNGYDELRKAALLAGFGEVPIKTTTTKTTEHMNFSWQKGAGQ